MEDHKQGKEGQKKPIFYQPPNEASTIDHVIAIMSGKGGVGKSLVTALSALAVQRAGWNTAILDADITGPSIPKSFGVKGPLTAKNGHARAIDSNSGIQIMSTNLILPKETDPVLWKGAMVEKAVKQFWTDVVYENVDYLFIDMPPGTGDVPLAVFQTIPIDGVIIVTSPQDLVSMIVEKAINMARMMSIPILGLVENMSYFHAEDTGHDYQVFGDSHIEEICAQHGVDLLAKLPIDPSISRLVDGGRIEEADTSKLADLVKKIEQVTR